MLKSRDLKVGNDRAWLHNDNGYLKNAIIAGEQYT